MVDLRAALLAGLLLVSACASKPTPTQPEDPLALGSVLDDRSGPTQGPSGGLVSHRSGSQVIGGPDLGTIPTVGGGAPAAPSGALSIGSGGS